MFIHSTLRRAAAAATVFLFCDAAIYGSQTTLSPLQTPPTYRQVPDENRPTTRIPTPIHPIVSPAPNPPPPLPPLPPPPPPTPPPTSSLLPPRPPPPHQHPA